MATIHVEATKIGEVVDQLATQLREVFDGTHTAEYVASRVLCKVCEADKPAALVQIDGKLASRLYWDNVIEPTIEVKIYADMDDQGTSFTVYKNKQCMGTFLEGDKELEKYRKAGVELQGLDNRYPS